MIKRESIVPVSHVNKKELILSTILKVYAIREEVEERIEENKLSNVPLLGGLATMLASPSLSKYQHKDATAFVTATCTTKESLVLMEQISGFKSRLAVQKPLKIWFSYVGLVLPILLALLAEAYLFYMNVITQMPYIAIAIVLVIVAVIASIVLYAYLGFDPSHRRDTIEKSIWKAMHGEAVRRLKKSGVIKSHVQLTPKASARDQE